MLELEYLTKGRLEVTTRQVEPYLLFRGQEAWYLEAFCLLAQAQRTFKLERIRSARAHRRRLRASAGDGPDFRTQRAGVHPRRCGHLVHRPLRAPLAAASGGPGVEFATLADGRLEARIPYADEGWMAYDVLRFLGEAVLERPQSARDSIRELAAALAARYDSGAGTRPRRRRHHEVLAPLDSQRHRHLSWRST